MLFKIIKLTSYLCHYDLFGLLCSLSAIKDCLYCREILHYEKAYRKSRNEDIKTGPRTEETVPFARPAMNVMA